MLRMLLLFSVLWSVLLLFISHNSDGPWWAIQNYCRGHWSTRFSWWCQAKPNQYFSLYICLVHWSLAFDSLQHTQTRMAKYCATHGSGNWLRVSWARQDDNSDNVLWFVDWETTPTVPCLLWTRHVCTMGEHTGSDVMMSDNGCTRFGLS